MGKVVHRVVNPQVVHLEERVNLLHRVVIAEMALLMQMVVNQVEQELDLVLVGELLVDFH